MKVIGGLLLLVGVFVLLGGSILVGVIVCIVGAAFVL